MGINVKVMVEVTCAFEHCNEKLPIISHNPSTFSGWDYTQVSAKATQQGWLIERSGESIYTLCPQHKKLNRLVDEITPYYTNDEEKIQE